jgi:hypothetical protein
LRRYEFNVWNNWNEWNYWNLLRESFNRSIGSNGFRRSQTV